MALRIPSAAPMLVEVAVSDDDQIDVRHLADACAELAQYGFGLTGDRPGR